MRSRSKSKPTEAIARPNWQLRGWAACLILTLAVFCVYAPTLRNGFIYDDEEIILGHPAPRSPGDFARMFAERHFPNLPYYRPITRLTVLGQKTLFGEDPAAYHALNVLLMAVAALLAYAVLRLSQFGYSPAAACLTAAMFALHPIASSCVNPISSGRETLLPTVWSLLAIYAYLRPGAASRVIAMLAFAGALFSKEQAVVLPLLFLFADFLWMNAVDRRQPRQWIWRYLPMAGIILIYGMIRYRLFTGSELQAGSLSGPFLSVLYAVQTIFVPFVELVYEPPLHVWLSAPRLAAAVLVFGITLVYAFHTRALNRPEFRFWAAWFILGLLPTANLLRQEAAFDERYVFFSSFAVFAVLGRLVSTAPAAVPIAAIAACAAISYGRAEVFRDDLSFSRQWIRTDPGSVNAHRTLAYALQQRKDYEGAIPEYQEAVRIWPEHAAGRNTLGNALSAAGHSDEAEAQYSEAIRIDPDYAEAHYNLGMLLARRGQPDRAVRQFSEALRRRPDFVEAHNNLANVLAGAGDFRGAEVHFRAALQLTPGDAALHNNLANVEANLGKRDEAVAEYREALRLRPDYPEASQNLNAVLGRRD